MARFNLQDYETVEERLRKFYEQHPDGRIVTENLTTMADRSVSTWIVKASVYLTAGDQANNLPKATGLAFEIDGGPGANQSSALENAETSSIGRALANAGWSGNKRASREEMAKAERGLTPKAPRNWIAEADKITDVDALRWLYSQAKNDGADQETLERLTEIGKSFDSKGQGSGAGGSVSDSGSKGATE